MQAPSLTGEGPAYFRLMNTLSLFELNNLVSTLVEESVPESLWVTGELAEGRPGSGGHY